MSDAAALAVAALLLAGNAFFVGAEFALLSARRSQIEPRAQAGSRMARSTLTAMEHVSLMMAAAQLGITVCSLGLGAIGEPAVAHLIEPGLHLLHLPDAMLHPIAFVIAMSVVVFLHVVLGEMVPKNIALAGPERAALVMGPALLAVATPLRPVIVGLNAIANLTLRLIGIEPRDEVSSAFTREEVAALVEESRGSGLIAQEEYSRLTGALGFTEKTVEAVLLPLEVIATIPLGATAAEVEERCAATGFSRFPVTRDGEMVGYLHVKDVLETDEAGRQRPVSEKWIRPFASIRQDEPLHDALETLQRKGAHLARVVDDDGSTLGLATLEDVLEELVGVIRDAAHAEEPA